MLFEPCIFSIFSFVARQYKKNKMGSIGQVQDRSLEETELENEQVQDHSLEKDQTFVDWDAMVFKLVDEHQQVDSLPKIDLSKIPRSKKYLPGCVVKIVE